MTALTQSRGTLIQKSRRKWNLHLRPKNNVKTKQNKKSKVRGTLKKKKKKGVKGTDYFNKCMYNYSYMLSNRPSLRKS